MKVFGLGLTRTGTTSLATALKQVGYNVIHYPSKYILFADLYDCAFDLPVVIHYKALDTAFPGSKFIHTIRGKDDWLDSIGLYFEGRSIADEQQRINRIQVYGQFDFDRDIYSAAYDRHYNDVFTYFATRPQDLLVLDICGGDGWATLCPFLNIDASVDKFPYEHKQNYSDGDA